MIIESPRFGTLHIEPSKIIEFPQGLIGLEQCRRFTLFHPESDADTGPIYFILQSLDDPELAFYITDPEQLRFSYELTLSDEQTDMLQLNDAQDATVAVILSKITDEKDADEEVDKSKLRANLNAPLIINTASRRGLQHVFTRLAYDVDPKA